MDRSFLVRPEVVQAANNYVCIRLTSYEDETEKAFIAKLVRGEVANTSFAILTPDGKPALKGRGPGRGPGDLFKDAEEMAKGMAALALKYPGKNAPGTPALPVALNAKVGFAIAAGDNQPLIVAVAADPKKRSELEGKLAALAWDRAFAGRFAYAAAEAKELPKLQGPTVSEGYLLIEPDIFGVTGKVTRAVAADEPAEQLAEAMNGALRRFLPIAKTRRELATLGLKQGIYYETGIEVSGKGEANDRERYKKKLELMKKE